MHRQMSEVSKCQVLGPYHEHNLQGKPNHSILACLNYDVTRLWFSLNSIIYWWLEVASFPGLLSLAFFCSNNFGGRKERISSFFPASKIATAKRKRERRPGNEARLEASLTQILSVL